MDHSNAIDKGKMIITPYGLTFHYNAISYGKGHSMNKNNLTSHLKNIGIELLASPDKAKPWITRPSSGYPFPTTSFLNLGQVERHWKAQALQRINEVQIAERVWKDESTDRFGQMMLLRWAEGRCLELPKSLQDAIRAPSTSPPRSWRSEVEKLASSFGDASISWLHDAIIKQATSTQD